MVSTVFILVVDETLLLILLHGDFVDLDGAVLAEIVGQIRGMRLEIAVVLELATVGAGGEVAKDVVVDLLDQEAALSGGVGELHVGQ